MKVALIPGHPTVPHCGVKDYAGRLAEALAPLGIQATCEAPAAWSPRAALAFYRHLRRERYDVLHIQYPSLGFRYSLAPHLIASLAPTTVVTLPACLPGQRHPRSGAPIEPNTTRAGRRHPARRHAWGGRPPPARLPPGPSSPGPVRMAASIPLPTPGSAPRSWPNRFCCIGLRALPASSGTRTTASRSGVSSGTRTTACTPMGSPTARCAFGCSALLCPRRAPITLPRPGAAPSPVQKATARRSSGIAGSPSPSPPHSLTPGSAPSPATRDRSPPA